MNIQKFGSTQCISIFQSHHIGSIRFLICSRKAYCHRAVLTVPNAQTLQKIPLWIMSIKWKNVLFFPSLFCSVEKPSYAHSDQLLHCEPVLCWYPGHDYLPSRQSCSGYHRNMVLWRHALSDLTLFAGMCMGKANKTVVDEQNNCLT